MGLIPGLGGLPGGELGNPLQYSCLENPHGQRSLVGYSLWGSRESDMTEQLSMHTFPLYSPKVLRMKMVTYICIFGIHNLILMVDLRSA